MRDYLSLSVSKKYIMSMLEFIEKELDIKLKDDALDKDYRSIFGLSLDDLDKVGDILCNSE